MLYDTRIRIVYDYDIAVAGGRHVVRVLPLNGGGQRLIAGTVSVSPKPAERIDGRDFFGNSTLQTVLRAVHRKLEVTMQARVGVDRPKLGEDRSPPLGGFEAEVASVLSLGPDAPHHFLGISPRVPDEPDIAAWARAGTAHCRTVRALVETLGRRIHDDFEYDSDATDVDTPPREAFGLKRGVCQDFAHVMIAALRGIGVPAGYVSGVIRTNPPPGRPRLEGADAMHAWVRAWCGVEEGWVEYDPTNALFAGNDHIVVAYGRDYSDVAPLVGVVKTSGGQKTDQFVDVTPV